MQLIRIIFARILFSPREEIREVIIDYVRLLFVYRLLSMEDKRTPKRILRWKRIGTRTRGRPRKRWIAGIEEDLQIMGVRRWRKQCEERAEWKKIAENAKTYSGL
jgi:hypothetical protein